MSMRAPLDDPTYVPRHPPMNGGVPDVVAKWGAESQRRWFERFHCDLKPHPWQYWARFYCSSTQHRGECCVSCEQDGEYLDLPNGEPACCCRALKPELAPPN